MRPTFPPLALVMAAAFLAACSRQSETASRPDSAPSKATPPAASPPAEPATAAPTAEAGDDEEVSFSLDPSRKSRATPPATETATGKTAATPRPDSTPTTAAATDDEDGVQPAQWLVEAPPFYPLSLRMQGIEGRVEIRVTINTEGLPENPEVVASTEPRFNEYALAAVRASRFIPQRENGKPVASVAQLSVPFLSEFGSRSMPAGSPLAQLVYHDGTYYTLDAQGKFRPANAPPVRLLAFVPMALPDIEGMDALTATVKMTVNEEGQVLNPSVTNATNPEFARVLEACLPFWQFIPRLVNGRPVATPVEFPYTHRLSDAEPGN